MKANVWEIVTDHYGTLYNNRTKKLSYKDLGVFVGVPLVAGFGVWIVGPELTDFSSVLTSVSVLAGFLFAAMLLVLEVGLHLANDARGASRGDGIGTRMAVLTEVRANVAYAALVAILSTAMFGVGNLLGDGTTPYPIWYVAVGVILLLHLLLTLVMVVKRLYVLLGTEAEERVHRKAS